MTELQTGDEFSDVVQVTDEMSPPHLPNKVLSTPDMVRLIEGTCLFGVQDLPSQRQDGLYPPVTPLFGRAAGAVSLDEEELAFIRVPTRTVGQFPREVEAAADGALAPHGGRGLP